MTNERLLEEADKRGFCIVEASSINGDLVTFLDWISGLPVPWMVKYFDRADELLDLLASEEAAKHRKVVGVTPSDLSIQMEKFATASYRSHIQLLVIVGQAYRSLEDRNRRFYLRR